MYVSQSTRTTAENEKIARTALAKSRQLNKSCNATGRNRESGTTKTAGSRRGSKGGRKTTLAGRSGRIVIEHKYKASAKDVVLFLLSVSALAGFAIISIYLALLYAQSKHA